MPPKKKTRVKHPLKKNGMILPDIVAQVAQQVQAAVDQSPLDDDATTLAPLYGWRPTQGHVKLYTQQVVGPPPQPNEVHHFELTIVMMHFVPQDTIHPSREDRISA